MLLTTAGTFLSTKTFFAENTLVASCNPLSRNLIDQVGNLLVNKVFEKR